MNMLSQLPKSVRELLLICAIPNWFDSLVLQKLLTEDYSVGERLDSIVKLPFVHLLDGTRQRYALDQGLRQELLLKLKNERRPRYQLLHERALDHFVSCLNAAHEELPALEVELMFHLDVLFLEYIYANELPMLAQMLQRVDTVLWQAPSHGFSVKFYQGCLFNEQSNFDAAQKAFLEILQETDLPLPLRARTLNALGILYDHRGFWDRAIDIYQQSLALCSELQDVLGMANANLNLGIIYHRLADYATAMSLFQESYSLYQQLGDLSRQRLALNELGYSAKEMGKLQDALGYYTRSLSLCRQLGLEEFIGRLYNNLGEVHYLLCQWSESYDYFVQGLTIAFDSRYDRKRDAIDMLLNLGFLLHTQQRSQEAIPHYERALQLAEEIQHETAISQYYYLMGDLHERFGDLQKAQQMYESAISIIETMRINVDHEETRIGLLGTRQYVYHAMVLLCLKQNHPEMALTYVERAKSRTFLDQLGASQGDTDNRAEHPLTAEEVQARLLPGEALIEYFYTGVHGPNRMLIANLPVQSQRLREYLAPPDRLYAFIVTPQAVQVVELQANIRRIEAQFFDQQNGRLLGVVPIPGQPLPVLRRWHSLGQLLIDPLLLHLQGKTHLTFVPHGILHYFPLHTLSTTVTEQLFRAVAYAPSASVLLRTRERNTERVPSNNVLAIGVNTDGLLHAEKEATWIAERLTGTALIGTSATVSTVSEAMSRAKLIHFACHGHFRRTTPMDSGLTLADGELSAARIWASQQLVAELITLSACDTGLNYFAHGDEPFGLMRAFLKAGAQSLLMALWPVHEIATRLLMENFYQNWLTSTSAPTALAQAQFYTRTMTYPTLTTRLAAYDLAPDAIEQHLRMLSAMLPGDYPFDHPYYWAGFLLVGNFARSFSSGTNNQLIIMPA